MVAQLKYFFPLLTVLWIFFSFLSSVESNIRIHLLQHITMSAVERGLRDHSKPFHYEGFLLGNEGIFLFLILFSSLADMLSDLAMARSWRVCSFNQNCHCWILQLGLEWAPSKNLGMLLEQNGAKCLGWGGGKWLLFAGGCRMLVFPVSCWMGLNHHNKVFRVVSQSVVALLLLMKIHIIVVSTFLQLLPGAWECLSSPTPPSSPIWFGDKRCLNPPRFFSLPMACVT